MAGATPVKIGLVRYPGVQMSAVLGVTDLFGIADDVVRRRSKTDPSPFLRIEQLDWGSGDGTDAPSFNSGADVLILPPALGTPISPHSPG